MAKEIDNQFNSQHFIENYTLTEDFLLKMEQIGKEYENLLPEFETSNIPYNGSIKEFTAYIFDQPKLMSILKNNNITPKDFAVGCNMFEVILMALSWGFEFDEKKTVFLSNLEFGKKHMYRILAVASKICNPIKKKETANKFNFPHVIANYILTEDLLLKMEQINKEKCENSPPESKVSNTEKASDIEIEHDDSIKGLVASISNQPKLMNILRKNNITPKDFSIATLALQATLTMLSVPLEILKKEGISFDEKSTVVSDNLEFGKKHMYRMLVILKRRCK
ncbi:hypothetical protein [Bartonella doshiae]|uniref:hypothetical protein n=1 Tax=Bartonella doshiae TaxID=33044 RepID=UPI0031398095